MGFEITAYVVDMKQYDEKMEAHHARVISSVDLVSVLSYNEITRVYKVLDGDSFPHVFFYLSNSEEPLTEDEYERALRALPLEVVLEAAKKDVRRGYHNRRYPLLVAMLEHILAEFEDIGEFGVVLYGH